MTAPASEAGVIGPSPFPAVARPAITGLSRSLIRDVADSAMGAHDVLAFWFGESDQPTPSFIRDAAIASLRQGETFYSKNCGRDDLREGLSAYLAGLHGIAIPADRVAVTGSGVSALMLAMQLIVEPGDRVVGVTPLWPNVLEIPRILGAGVDRVPLQVRAGRWALDLDRLIDTLTPRTRALVLNSPNNPTGWVIDAASLAVVQAHCRRHGIWLIADDVYERLVHDPAQRSAPSTLPGHADGDRLIAVNSFSKAWSMTGWRVGWIVAPPTLMPQLATVIEFNTSCVPEPVQRAAMVALAQGEPAVAALRSQLSTTRRTLTAALRALPGVEVPEADGAMYVFFRLAGQTDSLALAKRLVAEAGLGLAPGAAFGREGEGWLRWCHATTPDRLARGVDRFARWLGRQAA